MTHRVLVLGAGYAGLMVARRLARQLRPDDVDIAVVNPRDVFVERIRMHQLAVGQELERLEIRPLLDSVGARLIVGKAVAVDPDRRRVRVAADDGERELDYDTLVYAIGSVADMSGAAGAAEHAWHVADREAALRLRRRLEELESGADVSVVGGGMTGLEAATEIAETRPDLRVRLVDADEPGGWLSRRARAHLAGVLDRLGVIVHDDALVAEVRPDALSTVDGQSIPSAVTVWSAGFRPLSLARESGLDVHADGRIHVDKTMRSASHPDVYAVGDAAAVVGPQGTLLRMACGTAVPMAFQASDAIAARLSGREPHRFVFRYFAHNISLGRREGLIQFVHADDSVGRAVLTGKAAMHYKEQVSRGGLFIMRHAGPYLPHRRRAVSAKASSRGDVKAAL
ncbi:MAG: NAD(P)/FAD-dependent oxidoreductase [Stackebrandtia sp.]